MEPLHRFQQLIHFTEVQGKSQRFCAELDGLRKTLQKLHREAERVRGGRD